MRHNTIISFALFVGIMTLLSSCFRDNSTGPDLAISKLSVTESLPERYEKEFEEVLKIAAPKVTQSGAAQKLSYEWEINYKVVSTDEVLEYTCNEYGVFPCRLTIKNEDSYLHIPFELEVFYPFSKGIYALAKHEGKSILSFLPESANRKVDLDVLRRFNPTVQFGTEPKAVYAYSFSGESRMYVSTGNPNKLYRMEPNTMVLINEINAPRPDVSIDYIVSNGGSTAVDMVEGTKMAFLKGSETTIENGAFITMRDDIPGGGFEVAPRILYCYGPYNDYLNSTLYFDNLNGRFIVRSEATRQGIVLFDKDFKGAKLVDMGLVEKKQGVVAVLKKADGSLEIAWFSPGVYERKDSSKQSIPAFIKSRQAVPTNIPLTVDSKIATSHTNNLLYYSKGNQVYTYAIQSGGNFSSTPTFTCGVGEEIVQLMMSEDMKYLYVATNNPSQALQGSVYCFNAEDNKSLVWKKNNVSGEIKQIFERNF